MAKTLGAIGAIIALAAAAFCATYFGGGLLTKSEAAEPVGAALRAPQLAVESQPVALVTPTASPSPPRTATAKPKKKHVKKKHVKKKTVKKPKPKPPVKIVVARPTAVPTVVATAVPTRVPVYRPPVQPAKPKPAKQKPVIIIED